MMKIASYNINGINGRLPNLLRWLAAAKPDVVCLQELKTPDDKFPEQALLGLGYHAIWQGQQSWNGVAILSRYEIKETRQGLDGDQDDLHSRYIEAFINGVVIGCLYLPNGNSWPGQNLIINCDGWSACKSMPINFVLSICRLPSSVITM